MFLAQVGHESGGLRYKAENLNYSAEALTRVFGKYFDRNRAARYARNPRLIASRVYANRMGNGNELSQDGWKYRGRGLIQLTGHDNYAAFARAMGMTINEAVAYLETDAGAAMSAAWYWSERGLNELADAGEFTAITRKINGGLNGAADREALLARARAAIR